MTPNKNEKNPQTHHQLRALDSEEIQPVARLRHDSTHIDRERTEIGLKTAEFVLFNSDIVEKPTGSVGAREKQPAKASNVTPLLARSHLVRREFGPEALAFNAPHLIKHRQGGGDVSSDWIDCFFIIKSI